MLSSNCLLLEYRNAVDFCMLILYLIILPNSLTGSRSLFVGSVRFSQTIMSVSSDFYFFLSKLHAIFFLALLLGLLVYCGVEIMRGHLCLVLTFWRKALSLSLLFLMSAIGFFVDVLYQDKEVPSCFQFAESF